MKNPIKAYANLNQANRRWVTLAAGAAVAATAGSALVAPIAYGAAIADGYHFHKEKKVGGRIRAGILTFIVAATGAAFGDGIKEAATVTEAPAPVEQVAPAPAPEVVEVEEKVEVSCSKQTPNGLATLPSCRIGQETVMVTPEFAANWNKPSTTATGNFQHSQYWLDAPRTYVQGEVRYDVESKETSWQVTLFGTKETNSCSANGTHFTDGRRSGFTCHTTMAGDRPVQIVVIDPTDNFHSSMTRFSFR